MPKSYSQKIAYNTIIQIVGKIITTILSLVLIAYLTRYLGVFGYGEYTTVFIYLSFFGVFADFGFFNILVREISQKPDQEEEIASNLLTFRAFFAFTIYLIGIIIAYFMPYSHTIRIGIILISLASFFLTQNSSMVGIFQARHKMDRSVITDIIGRAIILGITIYLIRNNFGLNMIFSAAIIGNFINLTLSWLLIIPIIKLRPAFNFKIWREILIAAWPLGLSAVFSIIYFKIDSVMLSIYKGSTDVGIYGVPYKILEILFFVPAIFIGNVFPVFSRYIKEKSPKLQNAIQKSFDFLGLAGVGLLAGGIALSPKIIRVVGGSQFVSASTINIAGHPITAPILFQILLFAMMVSYVSYLYNPLIVATNNQKSLIKPTIYATILNIGLNMIFIPKYSYLAAATITVVTEIFILIYQYSIVKNIMSVNIKIINLFKSIISGLIMAGVLILLNNLNIFILIPIGVILYLVLLLILKAINKDMILSIYKGDK